MQEFVVKKADEGQTIIKYLQRLLPLAPGSFFYKMFRKKNIVLNDNKKLTGKEKIEEGDIVKLFLSDDTISSFSQNKEVDIKEYLSAFAKFKNPRVIYEDEHLLFIDKPVGLLSQKSNPGDLSVNEWLIGYLINKNETNAEKLSVFKPSICNRLDRNTGGLIIFAKTLYGANIINPLIKNRELHKYYLTLVHGNFSKEIHDISYLKKDSKTNTVDISLEAKEGYSKIETYFYPLKYNVRKNISLLSVLLVTGKSHQIRSSLDKLGFPIVGDHKYNSQRTADTQDYGLKGQVLYAYKLVFPKIEGYEALSEKTLEIKEFNVIDKLIND